MYSSSWMVFDIGKCTYMCKRQEIRNADLNYNGKSSHVGIGLSPPLPFTYRRSCLRMPRTKTCTQILIFKSICKIRILLNSQKNNYRINFLNPNPPYNKKCMSYVPERMQSAKVPPSFVFLAFRSSYLWGVRCFLRRDLLALSLSRFHRFAKSDILGRRAAQTFNTQQSDLQEQPFFWPSLNLLIVLI